jgi:glycosyltransferase involved in cell wall biosynthesis
MAARVSTAKDFDTFLLCADILTKERTDVTFLVVGDGPLLNQYKTLYNHNQGIMFLGMIRNIEDVIFITDISVLCSPSEGISNFILESMAMGKPVIATSTGGTPELISNNITGYLINQKDVFALKDKILILLNHQEIKNSFGSNAQKIASNRFNVDIMTDKFIQIFNEVMEKS